MDEIINKQAVGIRFLITVASFVIVVGGMQAAKSILIPFLLGAIIAVICAPFLLWLQNKGVPKWVALVMIIAVIIVIGLIVISFIGTSVAELAKTLPEYQTRLEQQEQIFTKQLQGMGIDTSQIVFQNIFGADLVMQIFGNLLTSLGKVLTNSFLILFIVIFMLLEASSLPTKIQAALGAHDQSLIHLTKLSKSINSYLVIKTTISLATGIAVTLWLILLDIDFPFLWGLIAFLFNYVPTIGSIIASVPAILLGLIQFGFIRAIYVAIGYLLINGIIANLIEPRVMGQGLNLSTLVVFLSLIFWGWVLGPVGMLLSVPLTMFVKIALESSPDTRWAAILLGSESSAKAEQQRQ